MSIHCGHCGGNHDSVADVRECSLREDDNTTMNPVVPDPGDAPSYDAISNYQSRMDTVNNAFSFVPDFEGGFPADPWSGATESSPGVWSPGPAAYLEARRNPPRDPVGQYPAPQPQGEEWGDYKKAVAELDEGFYAFNEGIYQTVRSKNGRLYAKVMDEESGTWNYSAGTIMKLKPEMRLKLDDAKAFGHRTGRCSCCGRTLTNPASIELGIGPICAERYF